MIRQLLLVLVSLFSGGVIQAQEDLVRMTPEQIGHLGIETIKPSVIHQMPLAWAPATISLPPQNIQMVAAPVTGFVVEVAVALGVEVVAGQPLARLRSGEFLSLQRAVLDADTQLRLATTRLKRDRTLLGEGIIARIRYEETQAEHDRAWNAQREAEHVLQTIGMSKAEIHAFKRHRRFVDSLTVRAPFAGVILERLAQAGQRVDLLAPLFKVGKLDELWVEIDMPAERLSEVRVGDWVHLENGPLVARITHVGQQINPTNQSAPVRAVVQAPGKGTGLKPGQHVNVQIMHASSDPLFRLPLAALVALEGKDYVFVRVPEGFSARAVDVASRDAREVVIHAGLQASEEVAVHGVAALKAAWVGVGGDE